MSLDLNALVAQLAQTQTQLAQMQLQLAAAALPCQRCPAGECLNYVESDIRYECTCGHKKQQHAPAGPPAGPFTAQQQQRCGALAG